MNSSFIVKKLIIYSIIILIISLSQNYINGFICNYLPNFQFDGLVSKISFSILSAALAVNILKQIKTINWAYAIDQLFFLAIYMLYRQNIICHNSLEFEVLWYNIYYSDIIIIICLAYIPKAIWLFTKIRFKALKENRKTTNNINNPSDTDSTDRPILKPEQDKFEYYNDAKYLLEKIIEKKSQTSDNALVIGLEGEWGQGKTSYLNMFKKAAKDNYNSEVQVVRFNPWLNNSYNQIAQNFLKLLANEINDLSIKIAIGNYKQTIINADLGWLSKIVSLITTRQSAYADESFDKVNNLIGQLPKLLIVQVDDIDRLSKEEVFNVLRLIRNVANFKNTVFIVSYDRKYLISSLKLLGIDQDYLDKIFNINYPLPAVGIEKLSETKKRCITDSLTLTINYQENEIAKIIDKFFKVIEYDITLRNTKRLIQSLLKSWSDFIDEQRKFKIDLLDYILITYLQQINSSAYKKLSEFDVTQTRWTKNLSEYIVISDGDKIKLNRRKDFRGNDGELPEDDYIENRLKPQVEQAKLGTTYLIMKELFNEERKEYARINSVHSYSMYFKRKFNDDWINKNDFYTEFNKGSETFKKQLEKWMNDFSIDSLNDLLPNVQFDKKEDWERAFEEVSLGKLGPNSRKLINIIGGNLYKNQEVSFYSKLNTYNQVVYEFLLDEKVLNKDGEEIIRKKLRLCVNSYKTILNAYRQQKEKGVNLHKTFFDLYWARYKELKSDYTDFEEEFWLIPRELSGNEKENTTNILKEDIKNNIDLFIKNYPIERIISNDCWISFLFENDSSTSTGEKTDQNSDKDNNKWLLNFLIFLEDIYSNRNQESKDLEEYIQTVEKKIEKKKNPT